MIFLILATILFLILYYNVKRSFDYWEKKGVKYEKPLPFVGNGLKHFIRKASVAMLATDIYKKFPNEKVVGFYFGTGQFLVLRDPQLAKRVLVNDFQHFFARGFNSHKTVIEPMLRNLFCVDGDVWKLLRQRFSPAFSTRKLKIMFPLIAKTAEKLQLITEEIINMDYYDAHELMARYGTDVIGECGFGIDMDTLNEENSHFRKFGKKIFHRSFRDGVCMGLKYMFPELCKHLRFFSSEVEITALHLFQTIVKKRNYKPCGRNDFIDIMLELKEEGNLAGESIERKKPNGEPETVNIELTDLLMTAQMLVFFGAGFETSSTVSSHTLHQLAYNPDCQKKVQAEIDTVLEKYNNVITYEAIKEMTYLEMVFNESMRLYPAVGYLIRRCTSKQYTFPEIDLTIEEDVKVMIPVQAIQMDEKYFQDPTKFNPERFSNDAKRDIENCVFLPFGKGPRNCVGGKLGLMQALTGLTAILQKYTVEPAACSVPNPLPDTCVIVSEGFAKGLPLKFKRRSLPK